MTHFFRNRLALNCLFALAVVIGLMPLDVLAVPQTANDIATGSWSDNTRWSLTAVPAAGPNNDSPSLSDAWGVTIDSHTITLNASRTIDSLSIGSGGTFNFNANADIDLTVNGAISNAGTFFTHTLAGSTITATGGFTNDGTFRVGGLNGAPQSDLTISSPSAVINNGLIQIRRNFGWQGVLHVTGAGSITNNPGATIEFSHVSNASGALTLESSIANSGSVTVNSGNTNATTFTKANGIYTNTATGSYTIDTPLSITGANSTFTQSGGTVTINSTGSLGGAGLTSYTQNGGSLAVNGVLTAATFKQNAGSISGSGTIRVDAITSPATAASLELNAGTMSGTPTVYLLGLTNSGANPLSTIYIAPGFNGGNYTGNITAVGKTDITGSYSTVQFGTTFQVGHFASGDRQTLVNVPGPLTNNGTINITNRANGWGTTLVVPGTLTNSSTGLIEFTDPLNTTFNAPRNLDATLINQGTVIVDEKVINTARIGITGSAHTNSGLVEVESGARLQIVGSSYTQTAGTTRINGTLNYVSSTLSLNGGVLEGSGTINASVNATGAGSGLTISPGQSTGLLDINGSVTLNANDTVAIELGGTTQAALVNGYDWVDVSGTTTLGNASLIVTLVNGFTPTPLNSFTILTATGGRSGLFGNTVLNQITANNLLTGSSYTFDVSYTANSVILSNAQEVLPAPEPSSLALLGLGALVLMGRSRRKKSAV